MTMDFQTYFELNQLYARYARALDAADWEAWPEFFIDHCVYKLQPRENHERGFPLATLSFDSQASLRDRAYLLWSATCRRYAFIRDFAVEVLREHYLLRRLQLTFGDYDAFYSAKALWHVELDEIAPSTQHKLRQNLFRMLREADLISDQQQIQPAIPSPALAALLAQRGRDALLVFPATDNEIQRWLQ